MLITKKQTGFTIVELLIVIIVIAILATLVITSYQNIQVKAKNSATAAAVQAYKKALIQYATVNNAYPITNKTVCLGEHYNSFDSTPNVCQITGSPQYAQMTVDTGFNNALKPYFNGNIPQPPQVEFTSGNTIKRGAEFVSYVGNYLDGSVHPWWIEYQVKNTTKCPVGPVYQTDGTNFHYVSPPTDYSRLWPSNQGVQCKTPLPDPTNL